ncbi:MAG: hypothetical protein OXK81_14595 [Chloroflexota bacterium]|nr:hypothetical protein [Chloroflexota bacterium]
MPFALPDSYRAYCRDAAVRTAVDHILSAAGRRAGLGLPPDIDWKDLPAFHRAVLSAHQVRCERAIFLFDLWEAVWRPALAESGLEDDLEPRSVTDTEEWNGAKFDPHTIWDNRWFGRNFNCNDARYIIAPGVSDDAVEVNLSLAFWRADDTDLMTGRNFGNDWLVQVVEENCIWTGKGLVRIRDDGTIDLGSLRKAAADALAAVRAVLRE